MRGGFRPHFFRRDTTDGTDDPLLWRSRSAPVLRCAGCAAVASMGDPWPWSCPQRREGDDIDHVIVPQLDLGGVPLVMSDSANPFIRYRGRLSSYHLWVGGGRDDQSFVALVESLDAAVARVAGHGFCITPLGHFPDIDEAVGARVWVKDETGNVAGSHKGRHLFGVLLLLRVLESLGHDVGGELVIASCGNAALAAATLAAAGGRHLTAFVPAGADPGVMALLAAAGAAVEVCPRDGRPGDPCYRRFRQAVAGGAIPFSCQGPDNGFALEGAATIAWEVAEGRAGVLDRAVIQVGGGALAAACVQGLSVLAALPVIDTVQTTGAHPLERAVGRLRARAASGTGAYGTGGAGAGPGGAVDEALADAARHRSRYMWPWETEPASVATGILDDETYDWLVVARAMLATGGAPVVVGEAALEEANRLARSATGIDVNETGSAGLAGLLALARAGRVTPGSDVLVLFTGLRRPDTRLS